MERSVKLKIFFGCISLLMFLCLMIQLSASGDASEALLESEPVLAGEDKGKKIMYLTFDDGPSCNTEKVLGHLILIVFVSAAVLLAISGLIKYMDAQTKTQKVAATEKVGKPEIKQMFLTPNKYSRPGKALNSVKGIVIHYTANPGSTAEENRNYFENLRKKKTTYASSHFVVGIDGEIVQCVPLDEIAYASNDRNKDTISIECCHPNKDGKFTKKTYDSLIQLVSWLCGKYNLKKDANPFEYFTQCSWDRKL